MSTRTMHIAAESAAADAAIEQVLQAEQAARAAVAQCRTEAEEQLAQARERARRIAERAALRIARVHAFAQARVSSRLNEIERQRADLEASSAAAGADAGHLRAAIERLAAELTTDAT